MNFILYIFFIISSFLFSISFESDDFIIPLLDSKDLNQNLLTDFVALRGNYSRSIEIIEIDNQLSTIWQYNMIGVNDYFVDAKHIDINNDGIMELVAIGSSEEHNNFIYVFDYNESGLPNIYPKKLSIDKISKKNINPKEIHFLDTNNDGKYEALFSFSAPDRKLILCELTDSKFNNCKNIAENELKHSVGTFFSSIGSFDSTPGDDILLFINDKTPKSYLIQANCNTIHFDLQNLEFVKNVISDNWDLDGMGFDDIVVHNENNNYALYINPKETHTFNNILTLASYSIDDQFYFVSLSENLELKQHEYHIDSKKWIINDMKTHKFKLDNMKSFESLYIEKAHQLILSHDGKNPEVVIINLISNPQYKNQFILSSMPDKFSHPDNLFSHALELDSTLEFLKFEGDSLPDGMFLNSQSMDLQWTPTMDQLGFHNLNYSLTFRKREDYKDEEKEAQQLFYLKESEIDTNYNHLLYINDSPEFDSTKSFYKVIESNSFSEYININDWNVDSKITTMINNEDSFSATYTYDIQDSIFNGMWNTKFDWVAPKKIDIYDFNLVVTDGFDSAYHALSIEIHPDIFLDKNIVDFQGVVGENFEYEIIINQQKMQPKYYYSIVDGPENMWIGNNGIIHWIPTIEQANEQTFTYRVEDGLASKELQSSIYVNAAPMIASHPAAITILNQDETFKFQFLGFDQNPSDSLQWKLTMGPDMMKISDDGNLIWEPNKIDFFSYEVELTDKKITNNFKGALYVNAIPYVDGKSDSSELSKIQVMAGDTMKYSINIKDDNKIGFSSSSEKNSLQFEIIDNQDSLKISNGMLVWSTSNTDIGTRKFDIKGSDGLSYVIESVEVEVVEKNKEEEVPSEEVEPNPTETPGIAPPEINEEAQDTLPPSTIEPEIPDSLKQIAPLPTDSLNVE